MEFTKKSRYFDNSSLATYKECPRKYYLRHVRGWTVASDREAPALVFGKSWHSGMDAIWGNQYQSKSELLDLSMGNFLLEWTGNNYEASLDLDQQELLAPRTPGIAREMYFHYIEQRERPLKDGKTLAVEQPFAFPFPNLDDTWYVGRLDKVIEWNGVHVLEHKTTTAYAIKGTFQPNYVESWQASSQCKGYQFGGGLYYPELQDVWVDAALVHKKVHDGFKFIPVCHSVPLVQEWVSTTERWLFNLISELEDLEIRQGNLNAGRLFPKNEDACYGKYGVCPFLNICATTPDPDKLKEPPFGYMESQWEPFDILHLDKLLKEGKDG